MIIDASIPDQFMVTLVDLPFFDVCAAPSTPLSAVVEQFEKHPDLPGVLIVEGNQLRGVLSRRKCFEKLGHPFGTELFLKRPVINLYRNLNFHPLILAPHQSISSAISIALTRPVEETFEPLVFQFQEGIFRLIDINVLLLNQSKLLERANSLIQKQVEIGRALTGSLNRNEILDLILDSIAQFVPYDQGAILFIDHEYINLAASRGWPDALVENWPRFRINECAEIHALFDRQHPEIISDFKIAILEGLLPGQTWSWLSIPLKNSHGPIGLVLLCRSEKTPFTDVDLALTQPVASQAAVALQNAGLFMEVQHLATTDPLTGLYNRRHFYHFAEIEFKQAGRDGRPITMVMIDIDHFKRINDNYGHAVGDRVIKVVAEQCSCLTRTQDTICRFGGEEFILMLHGMSLANGVKVAERIRRKIAATPILSELGTFYVTVSLGVSIIDPSAPGAADLDALIKQADQAMYVSKQRGRNQTSTWQSSPANDGQDGHPSSKKGISPDRMSAVFTGISNVVPLEHEGIPFPPDVLASSNEAYEVAFQTLSRFLEIRDVETLGHTERVACLSVQLAEMMGLSGEALQQIQRGAQLHDLGKLGIPDRILNKPGPLDEGEWAIMRRHPELVHEILSPIPFFRTSLEIPYCHHEHWDGSGYPRGIKGHEIPLSARIFSIVDVWDALRSDRPYRKAWSEAEALGYIQEQAGKHFDPHIVPAFLKMLEAHALIAVSASFPQAANP